MGTVAAVRPVFDGHNDALTRPDHSLLATFPEGTALPDGWVRIGTVTAPAPDGPGVTIDGSSYDGPTGWTHF